jgi:hypothetical protein
VPGKLFSALSAVIKDLEGFGDRQSFRQCTETAHFQIGADMRKNRQKNISIEYKRVFMLFSYVGSKIALY